MYVRVKLSSCLFLKARFKEIEWRSFLLFGRNQHLFANLQYCQTSVIALSPTHLAIDPYFGPIYHDQFISQIPVKMFENNSLCRTDISTLPLSFRVPFPMARLKPCLPQCLLLMIVMLDCAPRISLSVWFQVIYMSASFGCDDRSPSSQSRPCYYHLSSEPPLKLKSNNQRDIFMSMLQT